VEDKGVQNRTINIVEYYNLLYFTRSRMRLYSLAYTSHLNHTKYDTNKKAAPY